LARELADTNTPQGFLLISDKYLDLSRGVHSKADSGEAQEEFDTFNELASSYIEGVANRFAQEISIIDKISEELE